MDYSIVEKAFAVNVHGAFKVAQATLSNFCQNFQSHVSLKSCAFWRQGNALQQHLALLLTRALSPDCEPSHDGQASRENWYSLRH